MQQLLELDERDLVFVGGEEVAQLEAKVETALEHVLRRMEVRRGEPVGGIWRAVAAAARRRLQHPCEGGARVVGVGRRRRLERELVLVAAEQRDELANLELAQRQVAGRVLVRGELRARRRQ